MKRAKNDAPVDVADAAGKHTLRFACSRSHQADERGARARRRPDPRARMPCDQATSNTNIALQRVVTLDVQIDAELGVLRAVTRGLADEHRRARYGREDRVGERGCLTAGAYIGLELRGSGGAYLQRALAALHGEGDGRALDRYHFADQLDQIAYRTTQLAGMSLEDRLFLRRGARVADIDGGSPVALQNVARHMGDQRDGLSRHIDAVDRSLVEVPRDDGVAGAVVGILADPAGAEYAAVADFEETPFEVISHVDSLMS